MRKYTNIGITLPVGLLKKVDEKAREITEQGYSSSPNRSLVIRMALKEFLRGGDN